MSTVLLKGNKLKCGHEDCKYKMTLGSTCNHMCGYILIEHQKRGCKITPECKKYKPLKDGKKIKLSESEMSYVVYDSDPNIEQIEEAEVLANVLEESRTETA